MIFYCSTDEPFIKGICASLFLIEPRKGKTRNFSMGGRIEEAHWEILLFDDTVAGDAWPQGPPTEK